MKNNAFRFEKKFLCNTHQIEIIKSRLSPLMKIDSHCPEGSYNVRSLYFDTIGKECFSDNEAGVDLREKYRIRIYNGNSSRIQLEIKHKVHSLTQKESCLITKEQYEKLLRNEHSPCSQDNSPVYNRFIELGHTKLLNPSIIVDYDRIPFTYNIGNVRITIDYNIKAGINFDEFFDSNINGASILPPNTILLEVKYTDYIPTFIESILQTQDLRQTSFSKYYLCKSFYLRKVKSYGNY